MHMTLNIFCLLLFYEFSENNFIVYTFLYICTSIQNNLEVQSCTCTKQNLEDSLEISLKKILHSAVRLPEVLYANRFYILNFFKQSSLMQIITKMSNILGRKLLFSVIVTMNTQITLGFCSHISSLRETDSLI